ncbi:MAG: amidohydrolase [Gammaproteobacteria bacterium]|nr:amidohydrolase [Gammaproteobacteria bacterium]
MKPYNFSSTLFLSSLLLSSLLLSSCGQEADNQLTQDGANSNTPSSGYADEIYTNARVYTLDDTSPWEEAIAVKDGEILAVGSTTEIAALAGPETNSIDLGGKMIMPGIHDTHAHPVDAGITELYECSFRTTILEEALETILGCAAEAEPGEWIVGGQWFESYFADGNIPKSVLDELPIDNPIFFMDWSVHNAWLNSRALELLAINGDTPDPNGGAIIRDLETGEATGILLDNAAYNFKREVDEYTTENYKEAIRWSIDQMVQVGITTYKDALTIENSLAAYIDLDQQGELKARVKVSLAWKSAWSDSHETELATIANRNAHTSEFLDTNFVKIMLDGIPPTYTAALIEPYMPSEAFGDDYRGYTMLEADELIQDVVNLDAQGITVKIHATGDASVRMALNAYTAARETNGDSGLMHEVSHAELIHPEDLLRFRELNVAPEMGPNLWYPAALGDLRPLLGEGRHLFWQINSLYESGAHVIYGSDWPVVPSPNPWTGIEAMVTRMDPSGEDPTVGWTDESVDLATAVKIFTLNGAIANKDGEESGSLIVGKNADFIVLNRNIFEVPIEDVGDTEVLLTVVGGEHVFGEL